MTRRALILGGTGMLAGVTGSLVRDGWHVVLPSRRYAPIEAEEDTGQVRWVQADWVQSRQLASRAALTLGGPADLLVSWIDDAYRVPVMHAVAELLAPGAPVVEVHLATPAGCPDPELDDHPTQQVVLGLVAQAGRTRWLRDAEIADQVSRAVDRALDGRPPSVHHIGDLGSITR